MKGVTPLKLFYVDDDVAARERVHEMGSLLLNPVIVCGSSQELLDRLDELRHEPLYAVILVDGLMNRFATTGIIEKLRRGDHGNLSDVPMIIVTGSKDDASIKRAADEGADAYIVKPFTLDSVMKALREVGDYRAHILDMRGQATK